MFDDFLKFLFGLVCYACIYLPFFHSFIHATVFSHYIFNASCLISKGNKPDPMHLNPIGDYKLFHWTGSTKLWHFHEMYRKGILPQIYGNVREELIMPKLRILDARYFATLADLL